MRIIRFVDVAPGIPEEWQEPHWGILIDDTVYALDQAPYLAASQEERPALHITGAPRKLDHVRLLAPVTPGKLVCVGRNYAEHAAELGNEVPPEPLIFLKPSTAVIGPGEPVVYPAISERVDHEGELAVVIGRRCRRLAEQDAAGVVFGYTIANDVTARDLQRKDGQWTRGKGFDTFAPVGPWIDTEFDPAHRFVRCSVNGTLRQDGNTALMIYSIAAVLAFVTQFMESIYDDMCSELATLAEAAIVGDGLQQGTQLGPLQNKAQFERVKELIDDARQHGTVIAGGTLPEAKGYFVRPTIVRDITDGTRLVDEEQFGPVLPVIKYSDPEDAVRRANASPYGLGGSVWSKDVNKAYALAEKMDSGTIWVNKHLDMAPHIPFGGAKQSGNGTEGAQIGLEEFTQLKVINVAL